MFNELTIKRIGKNIYHLALLMSMCSAELIAIDFNNIIPKQIAKTDNIDLSDLKDFERQFIFINAIYKKESGQIRYVYANKIASHGMDAGEYTEGSIFLKIDTNLEENPIFPSHQYPGQIALIKTMIMKDKKWKYSIFSVAPKGIDIPLRVMTGRHSQINSEIAQNECMQCHLMAESNGQVFTPRFLSQIEKPNVSISQYIHKLFNTRVLSKKERIEKKIPSDTNAVMIKAEFVGTFYELRPILKKLAAEQKQTYCVEYKTEKSIPIEACYTPFGDIVQNPILIITKGDRNDIQ